MSRSLSTAARARGDPSAGFFQDSISLLLEAVRTRDEELAQTWKKSEQWATIEQLCSKWAPCLSPCSHPRPPAARGPDMGPAEPLDFPLCPRSSTPDAPL